MIRAGGAAAAYSAATGATQFGGLLRWRSSGREAFGAGEVGH